MNYRVELETRAKKEFSQLPREIQSRLADVLDDLSKDPRPPASKKLVQQEGYRVRKGDYRILYVIDDKNRLVRIYRIGHRKEIYR